MVFNSRMKDSSQKRKFFKRKEGSKDVADMADRPLVVGCGSVNDKQEIVNKLHTYVQT